MGVMFLLLWYVLLLNHWPWPLFFLYFLINMWPFQKNRLQKLDGLQPFLFNCWIKWAHFGPCLLFELSLYNIEGWAFSTITTLSIFGLTESYATGSIDIVLPSVPWAIFSINFLWLANRVRRAKVQQKKWRRATTLLGSWRSVCKVTNLNPILRNSSVVVGCWLPFLLALVNVVELMGKQNLEQPKDTGWCLALNFFFFSVCPWQLCMVSILTDISWRGRSLSFTRRRSKGRKARVLLLSGIVTKVFWVLPLDLDSYLYCAIRTMCGC